MEGNVNRIPLATGDRYLTMVSSENNNKFYHMHAPVNGEFTVEYGRIAGVGGFGRGSRTCVYDECQWDAVYANRIAHGYKDISEQFFAVKVEEPETKAEMPEKEVKETFTTRLMAKLKRFVSRFMEDNYTVKAENITSAMVKEADKILLQLQKEKDLKQFNATLCDLWMTIPRAMHDTRSLIAYRIEDFDSVISREANYLDTVRALVCDTVKAEKRDDSVASYCDAHGIEIRDVTKEEEKEIRDMMKGDASRYVRAYRVENSIQREKFEKYAAEKGNVARLFHGTVNENLYSIIGNSLLLNPNARITGKMFGNGIYFANKAKKSIGYTSVYGSYWANGRSNSAYLMVFDVAMGNVYHTDDHDYAWEKPGFHKKYDSLHAHAGKCLFNDEIIIYNEMGSCCRYLVEIC